MLGLAVARMLMVHLRDWYHSVLGSEAVICDHHSHHLIACSMRDESLKHVASLHTAELKLESSMKSTLQSMYSSPAFTVTAQCCQFSFLRETGYFNRTLRTLQQL